MFNTEFRELVLTYEQLQSYMDRNYPHMQYKIKPFEGTVRIPIVVSNEPEEKTKKPPAKRKS